MPIAIDVALLLPPAIRARVERFNRRLDVGDGRGFRFDAGRHPHITLGQHFVANEAFADVRNHVARTLASVSPLQIDVSGAESGRTSQTLVVAPSPALGYLHAAVMDALVEHEVPGGTVEAFQQGDAPARPADVDWVAGFRTDSAYERFTPHITVGIGGDPLVVAPFSFETSEVAICRLGRFCTCRDRLAHWTLAVDTAG